MTGPCPRPECGGTTHTDGWGQPTQCPARRCPRCDCPDNAPQCDHCKVCPHATTTRLCPQVHRVPHDAHGDCPGWAPDDGTHPEAPPQATPLEEAQATIESLRYQIRRAREALATDEPDETAELKAAIARVRKLHRPVQYGSWGTICAECSGYDDEGSCDNSPCGYEHCPTLKALGPQEAL